MDYKNDFWVFKLKITHKVKKIRPKLFFSKQAIYFWPQLFPEAACRKKDQRRFMVAMWCLTNTDFNKHLEFLTFFISLFELKWLIWETIKVLGDYFSGLKHNCMNLRVLQRLWPIYCQESPKLCPRIKYEPHCPPKFVCYKLEMLILLGQIAGNLQTCLLIVWERNFSKACAFKHLIPFNF